jgi:hypothetical protein
MSIYPKWFARWRTGVWSRRLVEYQHQLNKVVPVAPKLPLDAVDAKAFWERLVTKALLKRTLWRKRAGIRKPGGGPISRGRPFIIGEPEWDLPRRMRERDEKLSDPDGRPGA